MLAISVTTTAVGLLGGLGILPSAADDVAGRSAASLSDTAIDPQGTPETSSPTPDPSGTVRTGESAQPADPTDDPDPSGASTEPTAPTEPTTSADDSHTRVRSEVPPLPADSGQGRRAVFSESLQRVWLVTDGGRVKRSYLVSGSVTDNLDPGTYEVYSRSEDAYGIDDSGTMKWFVRFTQGPTGAAIGFHSIPEKDGEPLQRKTDLGTPQSHGCIRQRTTDARAMWRFADIGDTVVVTA